MMKTISFKQYTVLRQTKREVFGDDSLCVEKEGLHYDPRNIILTVKYESWSGAASLWTCYWGISGVLDIRVEGMDGGLEKNGLEKKSCWPRNWIWGEFGWFNKTMTSKHTAKINWRRPCMVISWLMKIYGKLLNCDSVWNLGELEIIWKPKFNHNAAKS